MDKTLGRKIQLDKVSRDIENAEGKIKTFEEDLCYKQKEIEDTNNLIKKMKGIKSTLEKQLGLNKPKVKPVVRRPIRRTVKKALLVLLALTFIVPAYAGPTTKPKVIIAYDASDNPEYIGKAAPGTSEDLTPTGFFQIKKITYSGSNPTDIKWADGNAKYDNSWANKANLTYK